MELTTTYNESQVADLVAYLETLNKRALASGVGCSTASFQFSRRVPLRHCPQR